MKKAIGNLVLGSFLACQAAGVGMYITPDSIVGHYSFGTYLLAIALLPLAFITRGFLGQLYFGLYVYCAMSVTIAWLAIGTNSESRVARWIASWRFDIAALLFGLALGMLRAAYLPFPNI